VRNSGPSVLTATVWSIQPPVIGSYLLATGRQSQHFRCEEPVVARYLDDLRPASSSVYQRNGATFHTKSTGERLKSGLGCLSRHSPLLHPDHKRAITVATNGRSPTAGRYPNREAHSLRVPRGAGAWDRHSCAITKWCEVRPLLDDGQAARPLMYVETSMPCGTGRFLPTVWALGNGISESSV